MLSSKYRLFLCRRCGSFVTTGFTSEGGASFFRLFGFGSSAIALSFGEVVDALSAFIVGFDVGFGSGFVFSAPSSLVLEFFVGGGVSPALDAACSSAFRCSFRAIFFCLSFFCFSRLAMSLACLAFYSNHY